jgi:hypothetical protein
MNWEKFTPPMRAVGNVAILIGLLLVYLELRQNGTIARAEMSAITYERFTEFNQQLSDADFAQLYAKSLEKPESLNLAERIQMNSLLSNVVRQFEREHRLYQLGIFDEFAFVPRYWGPKYFGRGYGRAWWGARKQNPIDAEIVRVIDEEISKLPDTSIQQEFDNKVLKELNTL